MAHRPARLTFLRATRARPEPAPGGPLAHPEGRRSQWRTVGGRVTVAACVLLLVLVAAVAGWLPVQLMRVGSGSMAPTVPTDSLVVVHRWSAPVARMDVVAVEPPVDDGPLLVKRAVAVGGDVVSIEDGVLVVNGRRVCEPSIDPALVDGDYFGPVTVPRGSLFLLGDNRASSIDSRDFGPVPVSAVRGHVPVRVWPSPGRLGAGSC